MTKTISFGIPIYVLAFAANEQPMCACVRPRGG
jgi:hypothetical protein